MDKEKASPAADAILAIERAKRPAATTRKPTKTRWQDFGVGLMGCGVGIILGQSGGDSLLFGAIGFAVAFSLARRRGGQA